MQAPGKYFRNNVANTLNLLDAMGTAGIRCLVFSSTCASYGLPDALPITENHPQRPVNPYGESKLIFEKILKWYKIAYGLDSISLRYFNAAGATNSCGEHHEPETHLIPNVLKVALGKAERVCIFGNDYGTDDGTCVRDYVHVLDIADAQLAALRRIHGAGGRSYNLASS